MNQIRDVNHSFIKRLSMFKIYLSSLLICLTFTSQFAYSNNSDIFPEATKEEKREAKDREYQSILTSNINIKPQDNPDAKSTDYLVKTKIYDVTYMVYSREFVERWKYPTDKIYIDDKLPKEIKAMEISVITEGKITWQYLKVLMDNDLDIDIPDELDYNMQLLGSMEKMRFPKATGETRPLDIQEFHEDYYRGREYEYNMNFFLTNNSKKDIGGNMAPVEFSKRYFKDLDYYKFLLSGTTGKFFEEFNHKAELCFKKKGGTKYNDINTAWKKHNPDDFHCFKFSKKLIKQALPVLKEVNKGGYFAPYWFTNPPRGVKILKERNY